MKNHAWKAPPLRGAHPEGAELAGADGMEAAGPARAGNLRKPNLRKPGLTIEPVFGQVKAVRGVDRFIRRSLAVLQRVETALLDPTSC